MRVPLLVYWVQGRWATHNQEGEMNKKRATIAIVVVLALIVIVVLCVAAFAVFFKTLENRLIVENRSGVPITHLTVELFDGVSFSDKMTFEDIAPGEKCAASYAPEGDSAQEFSFRISGQLADGTTFRGTYGYTFSWVFMERTYVTIMPGGDIEFKQNYDRGEP
jgi:hypothetical protein